ncbi:MAG: glucose-1-phosphate adenylyltransferase [Lautropia sp.]
MSDPQAASAAKLSDTAMLQLPKKTFAFVLAGGRGSRLRQLTDIRAKPAVYFGGKFRIIDFTLSNCINSDLRRVGVLTQYKSHSLIRHLHRGWAFLKSEFNEFIDIIPAQQRIDENSWYRGTADAVFQNIDIVKSYGAEYIVVLAGDHIYKMDYRIALAWHVEKGKPCSVGCIEIDTAEASDFGVMDIDTRYHVRSFLEKPANPPSIPGRPGVTMASMGIYIFNAQYLYDLLTADAADETSAHDFGRNIIPTAVARGDVIAHPFEASCVGNIEGAPPYWRDVGTIDAYWEANIDLTETVPALNMYDTSWPIWTYQEQLPPAKFVHNWDERRGVAIESVVSGGCIVSGHVIGSLLFSNVRVHSFAHVERSVLMPAVTVGRGARLRKCIVDRGCTIPDEMVIGEDAAHDDLHFVRTAKGVTLVTQPLLDAFLAGRPKPAG